MIVSWDWLKDYLPLGESTHEVEQRLMMAGLNHESTVRVGDDWALDLEVTSNRPDCLGHLGIAREIAVLLDLEPAFPDPRPVTDGPPAETLTQVAIHCPDLCPRYLARVIRGVRIAPSPAWLARRLSAIGVGLVNNVVDVTNYVLMECGQPLHAFDLARLRQRQIVVRRARPGELFEAIDHKTYTLEPEMCVIADAERAVALGGVMGGADSEVSPGTSELLLEAAEFSPVSIRRTARRLNLHSPSSHRFERGVDPEGLDWASRRCCELILQLAGGQLAPGVVDVGRRPASREPVVLRFSQLPRILGIDVPAAAVEQILTALGLQQVAGTPERSEWIPPSWRRDLTREIDLVEEVARVHGYDQIPEDAAVPMVPSYRTGTDRVLEKVRGVMTGTGFDEAMTPSVVQRELSTAYSPWTAAAPLTAATPLLKGADQLRRSLVPSLLEVRRLNESLGNPEIELFEIARIYLPDATPGTLPREQLTLTVTSGRGFGYVKGVVETLLQTLHVAHPLEVTPQPAELLRPDTSCALRVADRLLGFLGELAPAALKKLNLRTAAAVAEISLAVLSDLVVLVPPHQPLSNYPSIVRDLNLIVDEATPWAELAQTVCQAAGPTLEETRYQETYRDPAKDGPGKKRLLFTLTLRAADRTMTNEEADLIRDSVVSQCSARHGAKLLG